MHNNGKIGKIVVMGILSCSLFFFGGCFDFSGKLKQKRSELITEQHELKDEIRRNISLLDTKDRLRQELHNNQRRLNILKEYKIKLKEKENE